VDKPRVAVIININDSSGDMIRILGTFTSVFSQKTAFCHPFGDRFDKNLLFTYDLPSFFKQRSRPS
jgi:hypothetical protein